MLCLGIETSCDETALALVRDGQCIGSELASQADVHALFGGVVPELASREHYRFVGALYDKLMARTGVTLSQVDVVAVTRGPGLLGALLVGVAFAKGLALGGGKPLVGVNHLHAHLLAAALEHEVPYPALGLLVSGGHTHIYRLDSPTRFTLLGRTLDDAAGEACDKFAKMLGLPYPGGLMLDRLAQGGTPDPHLFPRPYVHVDNLDFSFSGLKTAAAQYLVAYPLLVEEGRRVQRQCLQLAALQGEAQNQQTASQHLQTASQALRDVCASFMQAVSETLMLKLERAVNRSPGVYAALLVAGGVAANTQVRNAATTFTQRHNLALLLPSPFLCTDNGIMIAYAGWVQACAGISHSLGLSAIPRGQVIPEDGLVMV